MFIQYKVKNGLYDEILLTIMDTQKEVTQAYIKGDVVLGRAKSKFMGIGNELYTCHTTSTDFLFIPKRFNKFGTDCFKDLPVSTIVILSKEQVTLPRTAYREDQRIICYGQMSRLYKADNVMSVGGWL